MLKRQQQVAVTVTDSGYAYPKKQNTLSRKSGLCVPKVKKSYHASPQIHRMDEKATEILGLYRRPTALLLIEAGKT